MKIDYPNISVTQLAYVLAVAQHQHFGVAAQACSVTQPTLSMQIRKLEEMLGVTVFDRSKKPVRLTEVGKEIAAQASVIVQEMRRVNDIVSHTLGEVRGDFHLGVIPTLAPYLLPRFLTQFGNAYPDVRLFVREMQTDMITARLKEGHLDAGLLATPLGMAGILERPLFYEPFVLYTSESHPFYQAAEIRERDLRYEDIWLLAEGHCLRTQVSNLCEGRMAPPQDRLVHFDGGSLETVMRMIENGQGYTLLPYLAAEQIRDEKGKTMLKPFGGSPPLREISLVYHRAFLKKATLEALEKVIRAAVPKALLKKPKKRAQIQLIYT
jgi:LysR family transcriptional regulator, hydrogen peroxide-inducible genes activator